MGHCVLVQNSIAAQDIGAYNRTVVSASDLDNGNVFNLLTEGSTTGNTGNTEVWAATQPTGGSPVNLWMAATPEVVLTGGKFKGIDPDPRNFYNVAGSMVDAVKLQAGDIFTITADGLDSSTVQDYALGTQDSYKFSWHGSEVSDRTCLKYIKTTYISIGTGGIDNQRVTAYKFEVITP